MKQVTLFLEFFFSFSFSQCMQGHKWIYSLQQCICSNKDAFYCLHKPGYPCLNVSFYSGLNCVAWWWESVHIKATRQQYFLLWHLWFGVKVTTNPEARVPQQELQGKCSLPSGLIIPAYLGAASTMLMKSPLSSVGWRGTSLLSAYGCDLTLKEWVSGSFPIDVSKHKSNRLFPRR